MELIPNPGRRSFSSLMSLAVLGTLAAGNTNAQSIAAASGSAPRSQGPSPWNAVWNHDQVALLIIDYQKEMFDAIRSETPPDLIELNTIFMIRIAKALDIPIVISSVGVELGVNGPTRPSILAELPGATVIDRSTMDAWEDPVFRGAVQATGRRRLIFGALFTEVCLAFPVVDALKDGYEVQFVADMVGGQSQVAHASAIQRIIQAGAIPNSVLGLCAELFRDWKSIQGKKATPVIVAYLTELKKRGLR